MTWIYLLIALGGAAACVATIAHSARAFFEAGEDAPRKPSVLAIPGLLVFDLTALLAPVVLVGVVPTFAAMFADFGGPLPLVSRLVLSASSSLMGLGIFGPLLFVAFAAALAEGTRRTLLHLPARLGILVLLGGGLGAFLAGAGLLIGLYAPLFTMASSVE